MRKLSPTAHRTDHDNDPLHDLLRLAKGLHPNWTDPQRFHETKSELLGAIKSLLATGGAVVPAVRPPKTAPVPPVPPPSRIGAVSPAPAPTPTPLPSWPSAQPLTLTLSTERYDHLIALLTAPTRRRRTGFQTRFRRWMLTIDESTRSVTLSGGDVRWVQRMIVARKAGGWQAAIARIFSDLHPVFTGLPTRPRPRRSQQRRWRRSGP
jgi:hypothetical protein